MPCLDPETGPEVGSDRVWWPSRMCVPIWLTERGLWPEKAKGTARSQGAVLGRRNTPMSEGLLWSCLKIDDSSEREACFRRLAEDPPMA